MRSSLSLYSALAALVLLAAFGGCSHRPRVTAPSSDVPTPKVDVLIEHTGDAAAARVTWSVDGPVDHFLVADHATSLEHAAWGATREGGRVVPLHRVTVGAMREAVATWGHSIFAVRAVDDHGRASAAATVAFFGDDVAPTIRITEPAPWHLFMRYVSPTFRVTWSAYDPDGPRKLPAQIRWKLFSQGDGLFNTVLQYPDTLNSLYAPTFSSWNELPADSAGVTLSGLEVGRSYLLVVTALDREGAWDPLFSLDRNMLHMTVAVPGVLGPILRFWSESFVYEYPTGGTLNVAPINVTLPAHEQMTIHWTGGSEAGIDTRWYRWVLDPIDLFDESARRPPPRDVRHWSAWSPDFTSATLGPYEAGEVHDLYVEAQDDAGQTSLGHVHLSVIPAPSFTRDLLIVNDTRFAPDQRSQVRPDSIEAPLGTWPTAAELDTLLFARGGVRWRMTPDGTISPSGLFWGYSFDTIGTRTGQADPTIPLEVLGRYRHVVWMTDAGGARYSAQELGGPPTDPLRPQTTLRWQCGIEHINPLATYVAAGGDLWLMGGGAAYATLADRNRRANDTPDAVVFSSTTPELGPGALLYDLGRLRSEIRVTKGLPTFHITRDVHATAPAGRYALLPTSLGPKSPDTDPLFPFREPNEFYTNPRGGIEWVSSPNIAGDPRNASPHHALDIPVLDTLCSVSGSVFDRTPSAGDAGTSPCMTVAHPAGQGTFVFSGFDVWRFRQDQCRQLIDAVLQGIWGLRRGATSPRAPAGHPGASSLRRPPTSAAARANALARPSQPR